MAAKLIPYSLMSIATLSGFNWTTHYQHPKDPNLPYILFTHGFPSSAYDWRYQVEYFGNKGYGIIAPDCLGYGSSDAPKDYHSYRLQTIADSIMEVVNKVAGPETKVMGVAHDWGASLQSRVANRYPDRFQSYTFLTPYIAPGGFDVKAANERSKKASGYEAFGYWLFFNSSTSGPIIDAHKKQFADLLYPKENAFWIQNFAPVGACEAFLQDGKDVAHAPWLTDQEQQTHYEIFDKTGYTPALCYYKSSMSDLNQADEAAIPEANKTTSLPTMLISSTADPLLTSNQSVTWTKAFAQDLTVKHVDAGHWSQLERPNDVNNYLEQFFNAQRK